MQKDKIIKNVLIWDSDAPFNLDSNQIILWRDHENINDLSNKIVSMPHLVEEMASNLRSSYLEWVYIFGKTKVAKKSIIEHLEIRPGLSYWWMASIAQKCNILNNSRINDAVKLIALEKLLSGSGHCNLILYSSNARLAECLSMYCDQNGWSYEWKQVKEKRKTTWFQRRNWHRNLPRTVRTLLSFSYYIGSRLFIISNFTRRRLPEGNISFFDIFAHLDKEGMKSGHFKSNYWGLLVDKLSLRDETVNWFHLFYKHKAIPSFYVADRLVGIFQKNVSKNQSHTLLDTLPSVNAIIKAWRDYLKLYQLKNLFLELKLQVLTNKSKLNLWPLHYDDWIESIAGPKALVECLRLATFEENIMRLPKQKIGFYICENQAWEMALIYAWKKYQNGTLVAVPHSTIRYWDLRYFYDPRIYLTENYNNIPLPNYYAVNGPVMKSLTISGGYPERKIIEVEALRFMYLELFKSSQQKFINSNTILICGDFLLETNNKIFDWLENLNSLNSINFIFKPHPAFDYKINMKLISKLNLEIDRRPLSELFQYTNIVITSAITSAAVDAYCSGKKVIQIASNSGLNVNALRGLPDTYLVRNQNELESIIKKRFKYDCENRKPYFRLDSKLSSWIDMIERNDFNNE